MADTDDFMNFEFPSDPCDVPGREAFGATSFGAPHGAGVLRRQSSGSSSVLSSSSSFWGLGSPVVQKWAPTDSPSRNKLRAEYQVRLRSSPGKRRMSTDSQGSDSCKRSASPCVTPVRRSSSGGDEEVLSDRFIPSRRSSLMDVAYSLLTASQPHSPGSGGAQGGAQGGEASGGINGRNAQPQSLAGTGNSGAAGAGGSSVGECVREGPSLLHMLLRTELLGLDPFTSRQHQASQQSQASQTSPATVSTPERERGGENEARSCGSSHGTSLFKFKSCRERCVDDMRVAYSLSPVGTSSRRLLATPRKAKRKIPKVPFKVLDAPALQDDFYLNLVDWSSLNVLAVGLGSCVYLWSACTSKVTKLCDLGPEDCVTSVSWTQRGTHLAVGTNLGEVQIWETSRCRRLRTMAGHSARIGTMAWNNQVLASGSRDRLIFLRDVRVREPYVSRLAGHKQEVCGLRWSFDDSQLASGGNDNKLFIWNCHAPSPVQRFNEHTAAVKAIAWSPHQHGLLASGGGTADRCIRFWNTLTGAPLSCVDTGSQVCNLMWSKNINELVSTHGYSLNQIIVWRYPSMTKVATLTGHTYRVLYLAMSPDGQTIVTGAGDETLRFWNAFPGPKSNDGSRLGSSLLFPVGADIR